MLEDAAVGADIVQGALEAAIVGALLLALAR
jgi:hypothetical protein